MASPSLFISRLSDVLDKKKRGPHSTKLTCSRLKQPECVNMAPQASTLSDSVTPHRSRSHRGSGGAQMCSLHRVVEQLFSNSPLAWPPGGKSRQSGNDVTFPSPSRPISAQTQGHVHAGADRRTLTRATVAHAHAIIMKQSYINRVIQYLRTHLEGALK